MYEVRLTGSWPVGVVEELRAAVDFVDVISDSGVRHQRGMIPWGDFANLVSAVAAAIAVGISLWDRRKSPGSSATGSDLKALDSSIKERGVFGVALEDVRQASPPSESLQVKFLHETSGERYVFEITFNKNELYVSRAKDE